MQEGIHERQQVFFGIKLLAILILLLATAHFGAAHFGNAYYDSDINWSEVSEIDQKIEVLKQERILAQLSKESLEGLNESAQPRSIKHPEVSDFIPEEGKFVAADLQRMTLALFEDGKQIEEYPILSKGRPGSHWETPSGLYAVNTKETNHFSSIGQVNMPYSMQFYGNFFIHGWPYYPSGKEVEEGYSGGCIRLSTDDAKAVFEYVDVKTPIYVHDNKRDFDAEVVIAPPAIKLRPSATVPQVGTRAYLIADLKTGDVFAEKNPNEEYPIASVTKLMTAIVANETISFDKHIPIEHLGEKYVVGDLLYPLLLHSDNNVALSFAQFYGEDHFMRWMNAKAWALGMNNTHFEDSSGLSKDNVSTVADLFRLSRYLFDKKQFILNISKEKKKDIYSIDDSVWYIRSNNPFAGDPYFAGGKLGFTDEALKTSLSIFSVPIHGELRTIAVIVLGSSDWKGDSEVLLDWLEKSVQPTYPTDSLSLVPKSP